MPSLMRASSPKQPKPAWRSVIGGLLAAAVLVAGCGKKAAPGTEAPADAAGGAEANEPAMAEEPPPDELAGYERELVGYEDAMLAIGLPLAGAVAQARTDQGRNSLPAGDGGGEAGGPRCERICALTTNICELRDHICDLGREHAGEPRYERACERATLDCEQATEACEGCDDER